MKLMAYTRQSVARALGVMLLAAGIAFVFTPRAQADGYGISVDIPLQFAFTGDINGTTGPSGYKVALDLPFHIGVGAESYTNEPQNAGGTNTLTVDYDFTDFYIWWKFDVMTVAVGIGDGSAELQPFDDGSGILTSADASDADQTFVVLGWMLNMDWEFHVAYHQVDANATVVVGGVADGTQVDLGGIMTSAGFKYMF